MKSDLLKDKVVQFYESVSARHMTTDIVMPYSFRKSINGDSLRAATLDANLGGDPDTVGGISTSIYGGLNHNFEREIIDELEKV